MAHVGEYWNEFDCAGTQHAVVDRWSSEGEAMTDRNLKRENIKLKFRQRIRRPLARRLGNGVRTMAFRDSTNHAFAYAPFVLLDSLNALHVLKSNMPYIDHHAPAHAFKLLPLRRSVVCQVYNISTLSISTVIHPPPLPTSANGLCLYSLHGWCPCCSPTLVLIMTWLQRTANTHAHTTLPRETSI